MNMQSLSLVESVFFLAMLVKLCGLSTREQVAKNDILGFP
jgi:hypothetical protein